MGRLTSKIKHAFAVDPPGAVEPTPEQATPVDWFCRQVARRRLTVPGLIALETARPLNYLAAQVMHVFSPAVWALARPESLDQYRHFAVFLEHRGAVDYLVRRIEHFEEEFDRERARRRAGAEPSSEEDHDDDRS